MILIRVHQLSRLFLALRSDTVGYAPHSALSDGTKRRLQYCTKQFTEMLLYTDKRKPIMQRGVHGFYVLQHTPFKPQVSGQHHRGPLSEEICVYSK